MPNQITTNLNMFRRIGSDWCVTLAEGADQVAVGTEVTVTKANGDTKQVTLGEYGQPLI